MDDHLQDESSVLELSQHSEYLPSYPHAHLAKEKAKPPIIAPRTKLQTLVSLLRTTSLWHLLFILAMFTYTIILILYAYTTIVLYSGADDWLIDGIFGSCEDRWYAMYRFAREML